MQILRRTVYALASMSLVLNVTTATVAAHGSDAHSQVAEVSDTSSPSPSPTSADTETSTRTGGGRDAVKKMAEEKRTKAKEVVAELKEKKSEKSVEARQKSCEARKNSLANRMDNAARHAEKHKAVFDKIFTRAQEFKTTKSLEAADYDTLVAAATDAGTKADEAIAALTELNAEVDCTDPDSAAAAISAFKSSVGDSKTALKDYREAIKNVIKSLKSSAKTAEGEAAGTEETEQ